MAVGGGRKRGLKRERGQHSAEQDQDGEGKWADDTHPKIVSMMDPYRRKHSKVNFFDICRAAGDVRLGDFPSCFRGKCINHILGKCRFTAEKCGHNHVPGSSFEEEDVNTFIKLIQPGVKTLVEDGPPQKRVCQGGGRRS